MTPRQRIKLQSEWWPAACRAQGWKVGDRALRLRVCSWAVSLANPSELELLRAIASEDAPPRDLASTSQLDSKRDVDRVKSCLLMLAASIKAADEVGRPQLGSARRKRDVVRSHLKCLGLYVERPRQFLASLVADMFNRGQPGLTIQDLRDEPTFRDGKEGPSELDRLVMRMSALVNQRRNENVLVGAWSQHQGVEPLTGHEMKVLAGVFCACAQCRAAGKRPLLPPLEEDWTDFEPESAEPECVLTPGEQPF